MCAFSRYICIIYFSYFHYRLYLYYILMNIMYIYIYIYIYVYIYTNIYIYIYMYIDRQIDRQIQIDGQIDRQIVSCRFIDNFQPTNSNVKLLECYSIFLTSVNITYTKVKYRPQPCDDQHIRERSRKPSTPQARDGAGNLVSPPLMLKHKTVVYLPLPHK